MTAQERLKAIIKERKEWDEFGWGPLLTMWAGVLTARMTVELWTGPRADLGAAAAVLTLALQLALPRLPDARAAARRWPMHGLWALIAVAAWTIGSWAPAFGGLSPAGAAVLEFSVLASGLVQTGILKARRTLILGGVGLVAAAVALAMFPVLWSWRPLLLAGTFGTASVAAWVNDKT
jgi:hypothetical protein